MSWLRGNFALYCFAWLIVSCGNRDIDNISSDLTPAQNITRSYYKGNYKITASTILYDSVVTNNTTTLLVGRYTDPIFGTMLVNCFAQFNRPANLDKLLGGNTFGPNPKIDSVVLNITMSSNTASGYAYGKKSETQIVTVHRIKEKINTSSAYFNFSTLPYDSDPLATLLLKVGKNTRYTFANDTIGNELIIKSAEYLTSNAVFQEKFAGLAFISSGSNTAVLRIESASIIIKYHNYYAFNNYKVSDSVEFPIATETYSRFLQIQKDRTASAMSKLANQYDSLPSEQSNGYVYIQSYGGLCTRLGFSDLLSFRDSVEGPNHQNGHILITRAELKISTDVLAYQGTLYPPSPKIYAYELNEAKYIKTRNDGSKQLLQSQVRDPFANSSPMFVGISDYTYTLPITTYIQAVIDGKKSNSGLMIVSDNDILEVQENGQQRNYPLAQVNRTVIKHTPNGYGNIKLLVWYSIYK
ncbi:MAG: DUF4270 family protein [Cytophagales bacterium]|nr:DUF4270 family protein [Cytophagales bacterium]